MLRLTVASVGGLGPLPPDLGPRKEVSSLSLRHTQSPHASPHSAGPVLPEYEYEDVRSFRSDHRCTARGEPRRRAGGQEGRKKEVSVKSAWAGATNWLTNW